MSEKLSCETCRWWLRDGKFGQGWCRAKSPILNNLDRRWPLTYADDWCGEHTPKEPT